MMMLMMTMRMILTLVVMRLTLTMKWMWMTIIFMFMMTMMLLFLSFLNLFVEQVSQVLILRQHVKFICLFQTIVLTCLRKTIGLKNCVLIGLIFEILQLSWYGLGTQFW